MGFVLIGVADVVVAIVELDEGERVGLLVAVGKGRKDIRLAVVAIGDVAQAFNIQAAGDVEHTVALIAVGIVALRDKLPATLVEVVAVEHIAEVRIVAVAPIVDATFMAVEACIADVDGLGKVGLHFGFVGLCEHIGPCRSEGARESQSESKKLFHGILLLY